MHGVSITETDKGLAHRMQHVDPAQMFEGYNFMCSEVDMLNFKGVGPTLVYMEQVSHLQRVFVALRSHCM